MNSVRILHDELSYAIVGAAMDVHNELGPGWDEQAYHEALLQAFRSKGIRAESKMQGLIMHHDLIADEFELDIMVEGRIILELKHLLAPFAPAHYLQLLNYLKFWNCDLGMLINFGMDRLQYERIPFTPIPCSMVRTGPWEKYRINAECPAELLESIFLDLLASHGLGYGSGVYANLFKAECAFRKLDVEPPSIDLTYNGLPLGSKRMDAFLMNLHTLVTITAIAADSSAADIRRMVSYLRQSGLQTGVVANFGKRHLNLNLVNKA